MAFTTCCCVRKRKSSTNRKPFKWISRLGIPSASLVGLSNVRFEREAGSNSSDSIPDDYHAPPTYTSIRVNITPSPSITKERPPSTPIGSTPRSPSDSIRKYPDSLNSSPEFQQAEWTPSAERKKDSDVMESNEERFKRLNPIGIPRVKRDDDQSRAPSCPLPPVIDSDDEEEDDDDEEEDQVTDLRDGHIQQEETWTTDGNRKFSQQSVSDPIVRADYENTNGFYNEPINVSNRDHVINADDIYAEVRK